MYLGCTCTGGCSGMKGIDCTSIGGFSTIKGIGCISIGEYNGRGCTSKGIGYINVRIGYSSREEGGCTHSMIGYSSREGCTSVNVKEIHDD